MAGTLGDAGSERPDPRQEAPPLTSASALGLEQPGRYQLRRELARGGQGVVWVAWDAHLGREVAFKQLLHATPRAPDGRLSGAEARFVREARITAQLDHPGIAPLYEVGLRADGSLYATQRLVRGRTLTVALAACGTWKERAQLLPAFLSVCQAVAFAHRRGVIHRDLKPDNVMVPDAGQGVVLDWGLGRTGEAAEPVSGPGAGVTSMLDEAVDRTRDGALLGTPAFMSPEQAAGDTLAVDARSDVWSLGVMLYQLLTGRRPFEGTSPEAVLRAIATQPVAPVRSLCPEVPVGLARIAEQALQRDPAHRHPDAGALALALSGPVSAASPGRVERSGRALALLALGALVLTVAGAGWVAARRSAEGPGAPATSIAVLPFADLSPAHDQDAFSDGIAEEILEALSRVEGLRVPGRASSFYFKGKDVELTEVAARLGVTHLLEGSVRRAGTTLRISAEVVRARDGARVWSQRFDRELTDVFAVQEEIARAVAEALQVTLLPGTRLAPEGTRTASPEAYTEYLLGRQLLHQFSVQSLRRSQEPFERALKLAPDYAPAWAGLAMALTLFDEGSGAPDAVGSRRRALEAATRAVTLAPDLPDGYVARANLVSAGGWRWDQALADARRAVALNPRSPEAHRALGMNLAWRGRTADGVLELKAATELDPLSSWMWNGLGWLAIADGQYELAHHALQRALDISPDNSVAPGNLALALLLEGRPADALQVAASSRGEPDARLSYQAMAQHSLGHVAEARRLVEQLSRDFGASTPLTLAYVHAWCGDRTQAFAWIDRALAQTSGDLAYFKMDPRFRSLRGDPRHAAVLRQLKLPP
jgi:serine/threonine-protein kinase